MGITVETSKLEYPSDYEEVDRDTFNQSLN